MTAASRMRGGGGTLRAGVLCPPGAMLSGSERASPFRLCLSIQGAAAPHHPHFPDEELRLVVINNGHPRPKADEWRVKVLNLGLALFSTEAMIFLCLSEKGKTWIKFQSNELCISDF